MLITCNGFKFFYNRIVHCVPFKEAAECIFSTQTIYFDDLRHSTAMERRFNLISVSPSGRVLQVGFCKRQNGLETRIISARPASRKERKWYAQKYGDYVTFQAVKHDKPTIRVRYLW